jgi:hypothetical protein
MNVRDIFALRKEGKVEEAYEAIRPMYRVHKGRYTTLCMFWTASDIFKLRLEQKRFEEAEKIYMALKRLVPSIADNKTTGFMHYAEGRLIKESEHFRKKYFAIRRRKEQAAKEKEGTSNEPEGSSGLNTDLTDKTDKEFSNSQILDTKKDSCDSCDSWSEEKKSRLLAVMQGPMSVKEMMAALGFGSRDKFLKNYLSPALKSGLVEMTDPNSPKSPKQRYRRTNCSSEN